MSHEVNSTPSTRWVYTTIEVRTKMLSGARGNMDALNEAGADGWEAVGMTHSSGSNYQVLLKKAY